MAYLRYSLLLAIVGIFALGFHSVKSKSCRLTWMPNSEPLADVINKAGIVSYPSILSENGYFCFLKDDGSTACKFVYDRLSSSSTRDEDHFTFDFSGISSQKKFEGKVLSVERKFLDLKDLYGGEYSDNVVSEHASLSEQLKLLSLSFPIDAAYTGDRSIGKSFCFLSSNGARINVSIIISVRSATEDRVVHRIGFVVRSRRGSE